MPRAPLPGDCTSSGAGNLDDVAARSPGAGAWRVRDVSDLRLHQRPARRRAPAVRSPDLVVNAPPLLLVVLVLLVWEGDPRPDRPARTRGGGDCPGPPSDADRSSARSRPGPPFRDS